jgi:hypothetical protein
LSNTGSRAEGQSGFPSDIQSPFFLTPAKSRFFL